MFRMYGRIVQILRYQYTTTELCPDENGEFVEGNVTHYAPTAVEAAALGENVQPLPLESDEWMDGLEVADVPDTMGEAIKIRDMGQTAYLALLKQQEQQAPDALHAASVDLMEMAVDQELRLTMLELGLSTEGGEI